MILTFVDYVAWRFNEVHLVAESSLKQLPKFADRTSGIPRTGFLRRTHLLVFTSDLRMPMCNPGLQDN